MNPSAIKEAADSHAAAVAEWHDRMLVLRVARAALDDADSKAEIARRKMRDSAATFGRLVGETGENE